VTIRLLSAILALSAALAARAGPSAASNGLQNALPPHAHLLAVSALPGRPGEYAVSFRTQSSYLGIIGTRQNRAQLLWQHKLPGDASSLKTPGPSGLFQATSKDPASAGEWFLAFFAQTSGVTSAIDGRPSGSIFGDERITVKRKSFSVLSHDRAHVGSVPYRSVIRYLWKNGLYRRSAIVHVPDLASSAYPTPNGVVDTHSGDIVLVRLEIAATTQQQETGLMYRKSLDPDSGMIFVWDQPVQDCFWMENTYIPLTVAFLDASGHMMEAQDMQPLTTDCHMPKAPYMYALEVNQGFFVAHGIRAGDQIQLHLSAQ
jgi:uncharacterized membrane protein (UPF0127 family)